MPPYIWLFVYGLLKGICNGCETGTYFENGECRLCGINCSSCIVESECVSCKMEFYGKSCSYKCPEICHDLECDKESGLCLSCIKGYFITDTKMCDECPENCTTCNSKNYCFACKSGSKDTTCEGEYSSCKKGSSCGKKTGYCFESCKDGHSGELCDLSCNSNCISCDRLNENNCTACALDRHGIACNETCPSACLNNTCNRTNGVCSFGCSSGYWGQMCNKTCPVNCMNCEIKNGTCLKCANGFHGSNCNTVQNKELITIVLLTVGLVAILALVVYILRRKRMHASGRWKNKDTKKHRTAANCRCFCLKPDHSSSIATSKNQIHAEEEPETHEKKTLLGEESSQKEQKEDTNQLKGKVNNGNHYPEKIPEANRHIQSDGQSADNHENTNSNNITYIDVAVYKQSTRKYIACFVTNESEHQAKQETQQPITAGKESIRHTQRHTGPVTALTTDISEKFWMNVWQKQCNNIILMLKDLKESEDLLVNFETQQKHGNSTIVPASKTENYTHRYTIRLTLREDNTNTGTRAITLAIFHHWSQKWSLSNLNILRDFYRQYSNTDPIMVYCSEQIDRCGTFIAYDMLKTKGKARDIEGCVDYLKTKWIDMNKETKFLLEDLLSD